MAPLQPLQQTVFEQGPQAATVPTGEPIPVYQEGQVILPEPINPAAALDPGIAWNVLGAETMKLAQNMVTETWDYLIKTKANSVTELGDKYQSKLNDLYQQQSLELYNANKQKRLTNAELMQNLQEGIAKAKEGFKAEAIKALGGEEFFAEDFDMSKWGTKYQDLAVLTRRAMRNIEEQASKLLYDSQRVANGIAQAEELNTSWKDADSNVRPADLQALAFNGQAPLPTDKSGIPLFGMVTDEAGNLVPKTVVINGEAVPVVRKKEGQEGYFFDNRTIEALTIEEIQKLIETDQMYYGGYSAVHNINGKLTAQTEKLVQQVLKNNQANNGLTAYVSSVFAKLPDNLFVSMIQEVPDLTEGEQAKAHLLRHHLKKGGRISELSQIVGYNRDTLAKASNIARALRFESYQTNDPAMQQSIMDASKVLASIVKLYGVDVDPSGFELTVDRGRITDAKESDGVTAAAFLQSNPVLYGDLVQVLADIEANPALYDRSKPETMTQILKETISRKGYTILPNPSTGTPLIVYQPELVYLNGINEYFADPTNQAGHRPFDLTGLQQLQTDLQKDPLTRERVTTTAFALFNTEWTGNETIESVRQSAIDFAKRWSPTVNTTLFESLYDATIAEKLQGGVRTQAPITMGQLMRLTIASTPVALEKTGGLVLENLQTQPDLPQLLAAARKVYADLPIGEEDGIMEFGYAMSEGHLNFLGSPNGGIPLQVRTIKGKGGLDYLQLLTTTRDGYQMTKNGALTPLRPDGTPLMFLPGESQEGVSDRVMRTLDQYFDLKRGKVTAGLVAYDPATAPGVGIPSAESVIDALDRPTFIPGLETLLDMDKPLTNFEDVRTFFTVNSHRLYDVLSNHPELSKVKKLIHEVSIDPKTNIPTYDENKTLFSDANMEKIFEAAIKNGAKTHGDFMGYAIRAMQIYQNNTQRRFGREKTLEANSLSQPEDFIGRGGSDKNVVLFNPKSDQFFYGVYTYLSEGYSLYQKNDKYYMFSDTDRPADPKELAKYRLILDAKDEAAVRESRFQRFASRYDNAKLAREIVFTQPSKLSVETSMANAARADQQMKAQAAAETARKQAEIAARKEAEYKDKPYLRTLEEKTAREEAEYQERVKENKYGVSGVRMQDVMRSFESPASRARREYEERKAKENNFTVSPGAVADRVYMPIISEFEGLRTEAYYDETGRVWTIGKGTTKYPDGRPVKKGDKITAEEAEMMAENHIQEKVIPKLEESIPTWNNMNANQQAAIISFAYNVGENFYGRKGFETITKALSSVENFTDVPKALALYKKSGGKTLAGLVRRRAAEAKLFNTP